MKNVRAFRWNKYCPSLLPLPTFPHCLCSPLHHLCISSTLPHFPPPPVVSPHPASQRIWSEWQKQCLKKCDTDVKRFWVCREENGLLSPFRCTAENEAMKLALQTCGRDEVGFAAFRAKRVDEIERDILARAALRELKAAEGSKG